MTIGRSDNQTTERARSLRLTPEFEEANGFGAGGDGLFVGEELPAAGDDPGNEQVAGLSAGLGKHDAAGG